uniref:O-methyltransferase 4 n=1 Tax=Gloriosa superba TaxID=41220 RepID=A0A7D5QA28_GLOSU|nr:O-methyltransferase 4 [Gloriosa superba]
MASAPNHAGATPADQEEEEKALFISAMRLTSAVGLPMVVKVVIELDVLEIIARAGPGAQLSPSEIASRIPGAASSEAPAVLDRMLSFLASHSVLTWSTSADGKERRYGLAPVCRFLTRDKDGASLGDMTLGSLDPVFLACWEQMKYAVLEGAIPFTKAHGMTAFEYHGVNPRMNKVFNRAMASGSTIILRKILDSYKGFEGVSNLVDVGGGAGATLSMIISKYPHIKGINFDLPHVVSNALPLPGVEHVGGDMFVEIPRGNTILMKWILHDWTDEHCLKILKNCWKALPDTGKVIIIEAILPETPKTDDASQEVFYSDLAMLIYNSGGKERTEKEFKSLAADAGFTKFEIVTSAFNVWVMELTK